MPLTLRQKSFVAQYLVDLNATQAAVRAGYSPKTANREGARLLSKAVISEAVKAAQAQQNTRLLLTADEVREQNAFIARFDPAEMFDKSGALLHVTKMPRHIRCALKSLKVVRKNLTSGDGVMDTTLECQFWDKGAALDREYRHFGLMVERIHVTNDEAQIARLLAGRKRAAEARKR